MCETLYGTAMSQKPSVDFILCTHPLTKTSFWGINVIPQLDLRSSVNNFLAIFVTARI